MDWFFKNFGFTESADQVYKQIQVDGERLSSKANGRVFQAGRLDVSTLGAFMDRVGALPTSGERTRLREFVGSVGSLHADPENERSIFQVASQCNLLEMVGPSVTPERGITGYIYDRTQGPACAIAAAAGTLYRNYFVPLENGQIGQTATHQVDTMADLHAHLGGDLWEMRNGYCLPTPEGLRRLNEQLTDAVREDWMRLVRIGLHWNTEVTNISGPGHVVHQAYCSAMPVSYSHCREEEWEPLGRLILEAAYRYTLYAAVENARQTGVKKVYLTLLGGGAFGNPTAWITDAIWTALCAVEYAGLDVVIVSYGSSNSAVQGLIDIWNDAV